MGSDDKISPHMGDDGFLEQWRVAAAKGLLFDNHDGLSVRDLRGCCITAQDRERLLLQGKGWLHKGTYTCDDGTLTAHYERSVDVPALTVRAWLGYHHDGRARCARFWSDERHDGPVEHALPRFGGYLDERPSAVAVEMATETEPVRTIVVGHATAVATKLHSTTEQDAGNLNRLLNALRTRDGIPYPEDLVAFREQLHGEIERHHASFALGWDGRRWLQLERGAWPTAAEAAQLCSLRQPADFLFTLTRLHPGRYGRGPAPAGKRNWTDLDQPTAKRAGEPLVDARAFRSAQTGYRRYGAERLGQLANHLAYRGQPTLERFWLLVFLCDADAYLLKGQGFTGLRYRWTDEGPEAELSEERLGGLCSESILRLQGSGADAVVLEHPFYYPPDYGVLWAAQDTEMRLPKDWRKLSRQQLLEICRAKVDTRQAQLTGGWLSYDLMLSGGLGT